MLGNSSGSTAVDPNNSVITTGFGGGNSEQLQNLMPIPALVIPQELAALGFKECHIQKIVGNKKPELQIEAVKWMMSHCADFQKVMQPVPWTHNIDAAGIARLAWGSGYSSKFL